jgi:hypothetical protein
MRKDIDVNSPEYQEYLANYVLDDFDVTFGFYAYDMDGNPDANKARIRTFVERLESEEPELSYDETCDRIKAEFEIEVA